MINTYKDRDTLYRKKEILEMMKACKDVSEWDKKCTEVKREFGGEYPSWWYYELTQIGYDGTTQFKYKF